MRAWDRDENLPVFLVVAAACFLVVSLACVLLLEGFGYLEDPDMVSYFGPTFHVPFATFLFYFGLGARCMLRRQLPSCTRSCLLALPWTGLFQAVWPPSTDEHYPIYLLSALALGALAARPNPSPPR